MNYFFMQFVNMSIPVITIKSMSLLMLRWYNISFSACVADLYENHRHEDGFLYVAYAGESAFGSTHTNLTTVEM